MLNIVLQYNNFLLFPIAGLLVSVALVIVAARSRSSRLSLPFMILMGHVAVWLALAVLEYASPDVSMKYLWVKLEYFAIVGIPLQWFIFSAIYTNHAHLITKRRMILLNIIPVTTMLIVCTNQWHHFMWGGYYLESSGSIATIVLVHNFWFWVHSAYSYLLLFVGTVLLISRALSSDSMKRRQIIGLIIGSLVPWASNCVFLVSGGSLSIDPTPIAFTLTGILYFLNISQLRLLDISPIARNAIVMQMPESIIVVDRERLVIDINPAGERLIAMVSGEPSENRQANSGGQAIVDRLPQMSGLVENCPNTGTLQASFALGEGGSRTYYLVNVSVIGSGPVRRGNLILIRDVTADIIEERQEIARVQAETELKEKMRAEARYHSLVETSDAAICSLDIKGNLTFMNQMGCRVTGLAAQDLIGKPFTDIVHPQDRAHLIELFTKAITGKTQLPAAEFRVTHQDGISRWFTSSPTVITDMDGFNGFNAIMLDVTARKQAEDEKHKLQEKAEVSSRLAAVGEMAAGIAHEINNPLTGVIGFSQLLMEMPDLPPKIREEVKVIADGSERVAGIVRRLLTFARQTKPARAAVNVNELIDNNLKLRSYVLRTANIEVITHFDPHMPVIMADPGQLQQVFLNIIVNAEYVMKTSHGRGVLAISTKKEDCHIRITFQDDGPGISREVLPRLFEAFFTTKDVGVGNGLGLSLSRTMILEHGGDIHVESEPGKGATFIIELPYSEAEVSSEVAAQFPGQKVPESKKPARILAVDDEPSVREYVRTVLSRDGYTIECAGDGKEALEKMGRTNYDVVFMDMRMPGMGGKECYESLNEKNNSQAKKVVFMTGDVCDEDVKDFLGLNHLSYMPKPFDVATLEEKVAGVLTASAA